MGEEQQILKEEEKEEANKIDESFEEESVDLEAEEWAKKAREDAQRKHEEEVRKKAEEKARKAAKEKTKEGKTEKVPWGMSDPGILGKVLEALNYKGGKASVSNLKVSTLLDDEIISEALRTGLILEMLDINSDGTYSLTENAIKYLENSKEGQHDIIGQLFLKIEDYKDIIYQAKMKGGTIRKKDIAKSFYILGSKIREELRKKVVDCFISFAINANILEFNGNQSNPEYILIKNGEEQLQKFMQRLRNGKKGVKGANRATITATTEAGLSCGSCGKAIMPEFAMCPYCGSPQKASCSKCGKELRAGWKMCPFCGNPR